MLLIYLVNANGLFCLKDKKGITITNAFQTFLKESKHKPKKNMTR